MGSVEIISQKGKMPNLFSLTPSLSLCILKNKKRWQTLQNTVLPFGPFETIHTSFDNSEQTSNILF